MQDADSTVFIGHSHADEPLVKHLVALLKKVGLSGGDILCTSLAGYSLPPGEWVGDSLRARINSARCVIGILTSASLDSSWVLSELGVAWGADRRRYILLAGGVDSKQVPGPLQGLVATPINDKGRLVELCTDIRRVCRVCPVDAAAIEAAVADFLSGYDAILPLAPGKLSYLNGVPELFQAGVRAVCEKSWQRIRIYAPTGVWARSPWKKLWFTALAKGLANQQGIAIPSCGYDPIDRMQTTIASLTAVYGLPPRPGWLPSRAGFREAMEAAADMLHPLEGIPTAKLYYLDVDTSTIPGTGIIQLDSDLMMCAFAVSGRHAVDYAIVMNGESEIHDRVHDWFEQHVISIAQGNILQDVRRDVHLSGGMRSVRRKMLIRLWLGR